MNKTTVSVPAGHGIGLAGAVFIVFLVLKLCGVIAWSWWWVTAPLWIPPLLILTAFLIFLLIYTLAAFSSRRKH